MPSLALPRARRGNFIGRLFNAFLDRQDLRMSRGRLTLLDDHLLSDVGISREEALAEAARGAWNAPDHWYR